MNKEGRSAVFHSNLSWSPTPANRRPSRARLTPTTQIRYPKTTRSLERRKSVCMNTRIPSKGEIVRQWHVLDAQDVVLGRLASNVALLLMGKHKPTYTPFLDTGDHVIVVNASKVRLTGRKDDQKIYRHHTGYPGGLVEIGARKVRAVKPVRMVEDAIAGMLPKNKLGKQMYRKLKVYAGDKHPHQAQQPAPLTV